MDNVTTFPTPPEKPHNLQFIGPFEEWRVMFDGYMIPLLTGRETPDGRVHLSLDHRFGAEFSSRDDAHQAVYLIANAMAIGEGYPSMYATTKDRPFAPKGHALGGNGSDKPVADGDNN